VAPKFLSFLAFLILLIPAATAIGISPAIQTIEYVPEKEFLLSYNAIGAESIETYLRGDLAQYAEIIDPAQGSGPRTFQVRLKIPADAAPGPRQLLVGVIEQPPEGAMVGGRAAYQSPVLVFVPYPGVHLEGTLFAHDININDTERVKLEVINRGTQSVPITASIEIFDAQGASVGRQDFELLTLAGSAGKDFRYDWDSAGHAPGPYFVKAQVISPSGVLERESSFSVGSLQLRILGFTKNGTVGMINPFTIDVKSDWNSPLASVYADVTLNDSTFKTPTIDMQPSEQATLKGYWDLTGAAVGVYDADIKVYYGGALSRATGQVSAIDKLAENASSGITGARIAIAGALLLIAILILVLRRRKK